MGKSIQHTDKNLLTDYGDKARSGSIPGSHCHCAGEIHSKTLNDNYSHYPN